MIFRFITSKEINNTNTNKLPITKQDTKEHCM